MKTVGQILRETREARFYTLDEVEKAIKIRKELLIALEADNYQKLPPATFVQGFIKNYARFLGLDPEKTLAIFRREFSDKKHLPRVMDTFANPVEKKKFRISPGLVLGSVVVILVMSFFGYLWFQYRNFVGAPTLAVSAPADQLTTDNAAIFVEGKTDPEVKVYVNSQEIPVSSAGDFKEQITLSAPVNKVEVVASSKFGQKTQVDRTVYLKR